MNDKLIHEVVPVGLLQCNCSILGDPITHEALVVDPGDQVDLILDILRRHKLKVRAIVSTHTHIDHVGGLALLHRATGAPVLVHESDMPLYDNLEVQAEWLGMPTPETMKISDFVKEGDVLRWGDFAARVLHTPGHTQGSISLLIEPGASALRDSSMGRATPDAGAPVSLPIHAPQPKSATSSVEAPHEGWNRRTQHRPPDRGRHFVCGQHRTHRSSWRLVSANHQFHPREAAFSAR